MKIFFLCITFIFSLALCLDAKAQISVNDVIINFKSGARPIENVIVSNSSNEIMYVTVTAEEIEEPGNSKSPRVATKDLLVSPGKFSIDGKAERTVRLLLKTIPKEREKVFRVVFVPQNRGFDEEDDASNPQKVQTILKVLTGMGLLVFAEPINARTDLVWQREMDKIIFTNNGNLHVRLVEGKACVKEEEGCTPLDSKRIYGGNSFTMNVNGSKTLYFTRRDGASGDYTKLVIPALK